MNKLLIAGGVFSVMMGAAFAQTAAPSAERADPGRKQAVAANDFISI